MIVEELVTKLGLEIDSGVLGTLEKFKSAVSGGLGSLAALGATAAAAFVGVVSSAAHAADEIGDTAEKLGVGAQALQELRVAAELSDVSFESLSTGLKFLAKNSAEAAHGSKEAAAAFAGVSLRDANGQLKTTDVLLGDVADRFTSIKDPTEQTRLALKIFGRSGTDLIPILKRGSEGITAFRKEAQELGVVFGEEAVQAADDFGRETVRVKFALEGLRNQFGAPFFRAFANGLKLVVKGLIAARPYIEKIGLAVRDAGERLAGMARLASEAATRLSGLLPGGFLAKLFAVVDGVKLLSALFVGLGLVAVLAAAKTLIAWALAAAPFLLVGLAIGLIVDELYNFIEGNETLLGRIIAWAEKFDPNGNPVLEFFKAAIALLFDLTDPKKWERLFESAFKALGYVNAIFADAFMAFQKWQFDMLKSMVEFAPKLWRSLVDAAPGFLKGIVRQNVEGLKAVGGLVSRAGAAFSSGVAANAEAPLISGGAAGPSAAAAISTQPATSSSSAVSQTNTVTINAANMSPAELETVVKKQFSTFTQEALPAVSGG